MITSMIPAEVQEVMVYTHVKYVGKETMERVNMIIDKYPEWFPWEHKYKSIPQEVHDAYYEEKYSNSDLKLSSKGIYEQMKEKSVNNTFTIDSLRYLLDKLYDYDGEQALLRQYRKEKNEELWNKHYGKYNLEYKE